MRSFPKQLAASAVLLGLLAGCGGQQDKAASTYPEPLAQEQYEHLFA